DLASADQERRAGLIAGDGHEVDHLGARRPYQFEKLLRVLTTVLLLTFEMNEYRPLTPFMALEEQSGHLQAQGLPASASSPPRDGRRIRHPGTIWEIAFSLSLLLTVIFR